MESKKMSLNVAETYHEDIGKGIVRLDSKTINELEISEGDYVLLFGKNETLARVLRSRKEDEGLDIVRMDSSLRSNSGVSLGEKIEVTKAEVEIAKSVEIAPTEDWKFTGDPTSIFLDKLIGKAITKGNVVTFNIMGTTLHYVVTKTNPKKFVRITQNTELKVLDKVVNPNRKIPSISYDNIGGLHDEIDSIREMVEIPLKHPEVFEKLGIVPPKGVLLHGPPGTGKTMLARALATEVDAHFMVINGPEIMNKYYGESEKKLREIFEEAEKNAPTIIFMDEIDSITPNRDEVHGEAEKKVVSQLLTLMDGLEGRGNVVVIAATNRPNSIDPALRRPGRFDREIEINPPNRDGRKEILDVHTIGMPIFEESDLEKFNNSKKSDVVDLDKIAELTHGFTGADLQILVKEAALKALKSWFPDLIKTEHEIPTSVLEKIRIRMSNFMEALNKVEPSALREVLIRKPNVKWESIGGLDDAKRNLQEMVEMPLREPEVFIEAGITAPKGVLLTGPPGTGKTMLAKAVATECEANFISVKGPELISKGLGDTEKAIREMFKKAKQVAPTVIFFDEFDSIAQIRGKGFNSGSTDKFVNQLLTELDGVEELTGVSIIAATNRADLIDEALKRPGRLDSIIEIGLADEKTRFEIFKIHTKNMPLEKGVDLKKLAKITEGFSGAQIEGVCQKAGLMAIRNRKKKDDTIKIISKYFEDSIKEMQPKNKK